MMKVSTLTHKGNDPAHIGADQDFLSLLQAQAAKQSRLEKKRFFPQKFDGITSFIGRYPWQVVAFISGITAAMITFLI